MIGELEKKRAWNTKMKLAADNSKCSCTPGQNNIVVTKWECKYRIVQNESVYPRYICKLIIGHLEFPYSERIPKHSIPINFNWTHQN